MLRWVGVWVVLAAAGTIALVSSVCDIMWSSLEITTSSRNATVYRIGRGRMLLVSECGAVMINHRVRIAESSAWSGRYIGPFLLWPEDSYAGVFLGDRVKGSPDESVRFEGNDVTITCRRSSPDGGLATIRIHYPDP